MGWVGQHQIPTCLVCTQRYQIIHEIVDEDWENWLPDGYAQQKVVDFSLDSDIHRLKVSLIHTFHLKLLVVAVLFAPPPVCIHLFLTHDLLWSSFANKISSQAEQISSC